MPDEKKKNELETLEAILMPRTHGFLPNVTAELNKPLDQRNISSRSQGGSNLSYIESWKAIEEANRIFGHGNWTREVMEMREVQCEQRENQNKKVLWYVGYTCRVRVTVLGALQAPYRDGCGAGQGIDADLCRAHESAFKEAESDAMKRALMTFGYPLGLALYDKTQSNVSHEPQAPKLTVSDDDKKRLKEVIEQLEPSKAWLDAMKAKHSSPPGAWGVLILTAWDAGCKTTDAMDSYLETGEVPA